MKLTFFISEIEALKELRPRQGIAILHSTTVYSIEYKWESKIYIPKIAYKKNNKDKYYDKDRSTIF